MSPLLPGCLKPKLLRHKEQNGLFWKKKRNYYRYYSAAALSDQKWDPTITGHYMNVWGGFLCNRHTCGQTATGHFLFGHHCTNWSSENIFLRNSFLHVRSFLFLLFQASWNISFYPKSGQDQQGICIKHRNSARSYGQAGVYMCVLRY